MNEEQEFSVRELMSKLGLARGTAETLVGHGYTSVEELAYVPQAELLNESGLAESQALAIRALARELLLSGSAGEG